MTRPVPAPAARVLLACFAVCLLSLPAAAAEKATAEMIGREGAPMGRAHIVAVPSGGVMLTVELSGVMPGAHAFHIHETGKCTPGFDAAGGHFAPGGEAHGVLDAKGPHPGDLGNIYVPASGMIKFEIVVPKVTLASGNKASLLDGDGSALVLHAGPDDHKSQPAGAAGDRIACGVIRAE